VTKPVRLGSKTKSGGFISFFSDYEQLRLQNKPKKVGWDGLSKHGGRDGGEFINNRFFSKGVYLLK